MSSEGIVIYDFQDATPQNAILSRLRSWGGDYLNRVVEVRFMEDNFGRTHVTDEAMAGLRSLRSVRRLAFSHTENFDDSSLGRIKCLRQLWELDVSGTGITDSGLRHLSAFPKLRRLDLFYTSVSDDGISHLVAIESLEEVIIQNTDITVEGADKMRQMLGPATTIRGP